MAPQLLRHTRALRAVFSMTHHEALHMFMQCSFSRPITMRMCVTQAATDNLIGNVMPEFQHDSAAGPSGASSLECKETCYWNHGGFHSRHCSSSMCSFSTASVLSHVLQIACLRLSVSGDTLQSAFVGRRTLQKVLLRN